MGIREQQGKEGAAWKGRSSSGRLGTSARLRFGWDTQQWPCQAGEGLGDTYHGEP